MDVEALGYAATRIPVKRSKTRTAKSSRQESWDIIGGTYLSLQHLDGARCAAAVSAHPLLVYDGDVNTRVFRGEVDVAVHWHVGRCHLFAGLVHVRHLSFEA